ncbi:MAG: GNAT family N-acetyltransferase [Candidatus Aminicenantes bacterium]|nr:GNAT family N-acetyltransferase [Candidatus Aminicenantes bacterium]
MISDISIEPFRGDLKGLESMAHSSWRDEYGMDSFPNFYRPAFLKYLFDRIPDKRYLIGAYQEDQIVSFLANLPQRFCFQGKTFRAVYSCLMVTKKELLHRGIGKALIHEALKLNQSLNIDFSLLTLEKGHRSTMMIQNFEQTGHPVEQVKRNHVVARILDLPSVRESEGLKKWESTAIKFIGAHRNPKEMKSVSLREFRPKDLSRCLELLNQYQGKVELALIWDRDDLACELDFPGVSQTLVCEKSGQVEGLINFIYHEHLGRTKRRWAWINHVAYPDLSSRERYGFIQGFLQYIKEEHCVGAIEWTKNYYSMRPLFRSRFFPYFRSVNLVSWTFNKEISLKDISRVYEVQI